MAFTTVLWLMLAAFTVGLIIGFSTKFVAIIRTTAFYSVMYNMVSAAQAQKAAAITMAADAIEKANAVRGRKDNSNIKIKVPPVLAHVLSEEEVQRLSKGKAELIIPKG